MIRKTNKSGRWITDMNFDEMKEPLKNLSTTLKMIKKEYEKKHKDFIRIQKGSNDSTM